MSRIDWEDYPEPSTYIDMGISTRTTRAPALIVSGLFTTLRSETARNCGAITLNDLLYYVRQAALRYPEFRKKLEHMVGTLPPTT